MTPYILHLVRSGLGLEDRTSSIFASRRGLLLTVGFFAWAVLHYFLAAAGIGKSLRAAASSVQSDSI